MKNSEKLATQDYPDAIAAVRLKIRNLLKERHQYDDQIHRLQIDIDARVIADPSLKNEPARKNRRDQLRLGHDLYQGVILQIRDLEHELGGLEIELERLRNAFSAAKLQARTELAMLGDLSQ